MTPDLQAAIETVETDIRETVTGTKWTCAVVNKHALDVVLTAARRSLALEEGLRDVLPALEGQARISKAHPGLHLWDPSPTATKIRALLESPEQ